MTRTPPPRGRMIPIVFFTFLAGILVGWLARGPATTAMLSRPFDVELPVATTGETPVLEPAGGIETAAARPGPPAAVIDSGDAPLAALRSKGLRLPIDAADVDAMKGQFGEARDSGKRGHEAVDLVVPRNTPVHAVDDGTVAKLFVSKQGGLTIYQFDPGGRFCYYYAHLERYGAGLKEGQRLARGDVIGFVGTSGNAPPNTPHLHFAIFELGPQRRWWEGRPLDPWRVFTN